MDEQKEGLVFEKGKELPRVTGHLVFQFGKKDPIAIANVYDDKPVQLILDKQNDKITFKDEDGQYMVLKIVPIVEETTE